MWEGLGKHLRAGLVLSILLIFGAAVTSFALSFIALREVAASPITGWGHGAFLFPICIDIGLLGCEVAFLTLSMMKGNGLQQLGMAFFMVVFGALTVWFNTTRVPPAWRVVTAAPPITGIILTIVFATLLKAFAKHSGVAWQQQGAPPAYAMLGAPGSPIQGAVWRQDASPYAMPPGWAPYGQMPSPAASTNGHPGIGVEVPEGVKRERIRAYLSRLSGRPEAFQIATGSSVVEGVAVEEGVTVSLREASRELDTFRGAQKPSRNGRRR
jgi:hypothetical protein